MSGTMDWGLANRLSKTINQMVIVSTLQWIMVTSRTHALLEHPGQAAEPLLPFVDAYL